MKGPNRNPMRRLTHILLFALGITLLAQPVKAQEFITISLGGSAVNWTSAFANSLTPGAASNPGNTTVTVNSNWNLSPGRTALILYAYFNSASAALAHSATVCTTGCPDIPSSAIEVKVNAGAFVPMTQTAPFGAAGASLQLFNLKITGANKTSSRSDTLAFNINLSGLPQLPADTYTGTLVIQAQATP